MLNGTTWAIGLCAIDAIMQRRVPTEQDYTKQIYKVADLMRSKLKAEATQAFNALLPKIKALGDSVEKDRQMGLMSALRKGIGKLQSPTS